MKLRVLSLSKKQWLVFNNLQSVEKISRQQHELRQVPPKIKWQGRTK